MMNFFLNDFLKGVSFVSICLYFQLKFLKKKKLQHTNIALKFIALRDRYSAFKMTC